MTSRWLWLKLHIGPGVIGFPTRPHIGNAWGNCYNPMSMRTSKLLGSESLWTTTSTDDWKWGWMVFTVFFGFVVTGCVFTKSLNKWKLTAVLHTRIILAASKLSLFMYTKKKLRLDNYHSLKKNIYNHPKVPFVFFPCWKTWSRLRFNTIRFVRFNLQ